MSERFRMHRIECACVKNEAKRAALNEARRAVTSAETRLLKAHEAYARASEVAQRAAEAEARAREELEQATQRIREVNRQYAQAEFGVYGSSVADVLGKQYEAVPATGPEESGFTDSQESEPTTPARAGGGTP